MVKERKIKIYMYFIIFGEYVEQQIFLTKNAFFANFASNISGIRANYTPPSNPFSKKEGGYI